MKKDTFDDKWRVFSDSIQKQIWAFEKDNKCSIDKLKIFRYVNYNQLGERIIVRKLYSEIDYEE